MPVETARNSIWRWMRAFVRKVFGPKEVRARRFVVEDEAGRPRMTMELDEASNTMLTMLDKDGHQRLLMGTASDGTPRITMWYAEGAGKIELEANDRVNTAGMAVVGPGGQVQVLMGVARNGLPAFALFDKEGNTLFPQGQPPINVEEDGEIDGGDGFDWDDILRRS